MVKVNNAIGIANNVVSKWTLESLSWLWDSGLNEPLRCSSQRTDLSSKVGRVAGARSDVREIVVGGRASRESCRCGRSVVDPVPAGSAGLWPAAVGLCHARAWYRGSEVSLAVATSTRDRGCSRLGKRSLSDINTLVLSYDLSSLEIYEKCTL